MENFIMQMALSTLVNGNMVNKMDTDNLKIRMEMLRKAIG